MNDISFSFCITTDTSKGTVCQYLNQVVESIFNLNIPKYEILIIGNENILRTNSNLNNSKIKIINFNDNERIGWITRKKNLMAQAAIYENIVFIHDYFYFDQNWYEGYKKFGDNFKVCINPIVNVNGERFRDLALFPYHHVGHSNSPSKDLWNYLNIDDSRESLLPYNCNCLDRLNKYLYISGGCWVVKKHVMLEFPLNESLMWSQGEDVDWSLRVLNKYNLSFNPHSITHMAKFNDRALNPMPDKIYEKLREFIK